MIRGCTQLREEPSIRGLLQPVLSEHAATLLRSVVSLRHVALISRTVGAPVILTKNWGSVQCERCTLTPYAKHYYPTDAMVRKRENKGNEGASHCTKPGFADVQNARRYIPVRANAGVCGFS